MAAKELSRTFDLQRGAVDIKVDNGYGVTNPLTIYVATVPDVAQAIMDGIQMIGDQADAVHAKMVEAGMQVATSDTPSTNG